MKRFIQILSFSTYSVVLMSQNIGINNTDPQVSLDINGALAHRSVTIDPFLNGVNIPIDASYVVISNIGVTGPITISTPEFIDGKRLVIQNLSTQIATLNPSSTNVQILPNEIKEFIGRNPGGYFHLSPSSTNNWSLNGNSGTNPTTNFIGTTDSQPLQFRVANSKSGLIDLNGNTSFGYVAQPDLQPIAVNNTVMGFKAYQSNKRGSGAVVIGANAAYSDTISNGLIAIGRSALANNIRALGNFAIGDSALVNTGQGVLNATSGTNNFGIGKNTLRTNIIGQENLAIGNFVLEKAINPFGNHGIGKGVLSQLTNGNDNIAFSAYRNLTKGSSNVGFGSVANISAGANNVLIGQANAFSFGLNDSIAENVIIGYRNIASYQGNRNVLVGTNSGGNSVEGSFNTALGDKALPNNSTGGNNVAIGAFAGASNTTGSNNVFIGPSAGAIGASSNKLYIENSNANKNNALIYGDFAADSLLLNAKTINKHSLHIRNNHALELGYGIPMKQSDNGKIQYGGFGGSDHILNIVGGGTHVNGDDRQIRLWTNGGFMTGRESSASGAYSTSMGLLTQASGFASIALGSYTLASNDHSTAMGTYTVASGFASTAMGHNTLASGPGATAMGTTTTASDENSTAMGLETHASGLASLATGHLTVANGSNSFSGGNSTIALGDQSVALGNTNTTARGDASFAIGKNTKSSAFASMAIGQYNDTIVGANPSTWVATDPVLTIGNGTSNTARSNAVTIYKNGNTDINGYVRLGAAADSAPKIKMKELPSTNTSATYNGNIPIPHGLTGSKIVSVDILVLWNTADGGYYAPPEYGSSSNLKYSYYVSGTHIVIQNNCPSAADCFINNKSAKILVTYKE